MEDEDSILLELLTGESANITYLLVTDDLEQLTTDDDDYLKE
jgi:hypothetical protein